MAMTRLLIYLSDEEKSALQTVAQDEMRGLREQTRLIVRRELERRGLLQPTPVQPAENPQQCEGGPHAVAA